MYVYDIVYAAAKKWLNLRNWFASNALLNKSYFSLFAERREGGINANNF